MRRVGFADTPQKASDRARRSWFAALLHCVSNAGRDVVENHCDPYLD
jgi:hypothetical protein